MEILEDRVPIRSGQLVHGVDGGFAIAFAVQRPSGQQCCRQVRHRAAHRLREVSPGGAVVLLLQFSDPDHQTRDAVGVVDREQPLAELARLVDIAIGEHGEESAAEQIGIFRIELQHVEVIGRGGPGIALGAGMARRQVTAEGIVGQQRLLRRRLGGNRLRGEDRGQAQSQGKASDSGMPGQQRIIHESSIGELDRLRELIGEPGIERLISFSRCENDRFAPWPQGRTRQRPHTSRTVALPRPQRRRNRGSVPSIGPLDIYFAGTARIVDWRDPLYLYIKTIRSSRAHGRPMLALRLPADLEKRLDALAKKTGRSKSFYAREAILRHLEDLEDYHLARRRLARKATRVTLEELERELDDTR